MIPPGFDQLGAQAARIFLDFVAVPAVSMHPDWRVALVPTWAAGTRLEDDHAALSRGVLGVLALDDDLSHFSWRDPACLAALLPPPELNMLARRLGLALRAPALLRAITQAQVAAIDPLLSPDDWQSLRALGPSDWPRQPLPPELPPLSAEAMHEDGLLALLGVFSRLPKNIGQRATLKLPRRDETCNPGQLVIAASVFPTVYHSLVERSGGSWHALWAGAARGTMH